MAHAKKQIALMCPGGPITRDLADRVTDFALTKFGDRAALFFHPQCFMEAGHFAGHDPQRAAALIEVANNAEYDAIWFARGGYGANRLDPALFSEFNEAAHQKIYLGYSDNGAILAQLYKRQIGKPVHGPIAIDFSRPDGERAVERSLRFLIDGNETGLEPTITENHPTVAFNITMLTHLIASDWAPNLSGHIVMLEDVGEYLYRIDRALFAIMSAPAFRGVAGVRLGRISDVPENDRPFGQTAEEIVKDWCGRFNVPYLGRADIGHDVDNKIVPFGTRSLS